MPVFWGKGPPFRSGAKIFSRGAPPLVFSTQSGGIFLGGPPRVYPPGSPELISLGHQWPFLPLPFLWPFSSGNPGQRNPLLKLPCPRQGFSPWRSPGRGPAGKCMVYVLLRRYPISPLISVRVMATALGWRMISTSAPESSIQEAVRASIINPRASWSQAGRLWAG